MLLVMFVLDLDLIVNINAIIRLTMEVVVWYRGCGGLL